MTIKGLSLLALFGAAAFTAAPAMADRIVVQRTVVHHTDNGWHHDRRHRVCRTRWVHHHRVTRCTWR
jgi:hypothetical protein